MHLRSLVSLVAAAGMLMFAAPALAAVDLTTPEVGIAQGFGCDAPQLEPGAYAVEMLFSESTDLALCEPKLLEATGLCLEPVRFDGQPGPGLALDIRRLNCSPPERSPPS
jgi:hypothetical protein